MYGPLVPELPPRSVALKSPNTAWHFAYGANMSTATLQKRGIVPVSSVPARVVGDTYFAFSHRGGYASLLSPHQGSWFQWPSAAADPEASATLYRQPFGVLYELRSVDVAVLQQRKIGYRLVNITVQEVESGHVIPAQAFVSSPWLQLRRPVRPTARYLNLIVAAAQEQGFDEGYIAWLRGMPTAEPKELSAPEYSATLAELAARGMGIGVLAAVTYHFL
jgi:AIG2-like family